ncbi:hypothetical protein K438DRAFT_1140870 [Mycena galopus ATCC 62051]|nr:hypothetical protein K438DRAFT_1140870 [Mycena galopus ATCC 62051]
MQPATNGHASGTGPPARRSLLGSTRAQQQAHASSSKGYRLGEGGAYMNGNANGLGGVRTNGLGHGFGRGNGSAHGQGNGQGNGQSTSTVPQKRKLGMSNGGGGNGGHGGSKAARREGEGRVDVKPMDMAFGLGAGVGLGLGVGSSVGGAGLGEGPSVGLGGAASGGGAGAGGLGQEGGDGQGVGEESGDEIRCRCGSSLDDGFSIACDVCGRWCHAACFAISKESVPEEWACWMCAPGKHAQFDTLPANGHPPISKGRRRASISVRRGNTVERSPQLPGPVVDDLEDERTQYVSIDDDIVPHAATQHKLRAYAAQWRGVSALEPTPPLHTLGHGYGHTPFVFGAPPPAHPTSLHPCFPFAPSTSASNAHHAPNASFLPPTYALHTLAPAPPRTLLARYPALITPSSYYLAQPANGYAHTGAPKRFVHFVGPPLDLALDARGAGGREGGSGVGVGRMRRCGRTFVLGKESGGGMGRGRGRGGRRRVMTLGRRGMRRLTLASLRRER